MSTTMDWVAYAGNGPKHYQEFLVPAMFGPLAEHLVKAVPIRSGMSVLDVACGTGAFTRAAARAVGEDGSVTGVDLSSAMLAVAGSFDAESGAASIEYLEGLADELPVPDGSFDAVTCQQGLQFCPDRAAALTAMYAALAPGGRLAVATWTRPDESIAWSALADALELHIGSGAGARMRSPWSLADPQELRDLLVAAGLGGVHVEELTFTACFAPRAGFARSLVVAGPLGPEFIAASAVHQRRIEDDVTAAVACCDGDEHRVFQPMTTNIAVGTKPTARG